MSGAYSIGSDTLSGLSKLIEELGEVGQVAGKIIGLGSMGPHWDGSNLKDRMVEEIADLRAAIAFFEDYNGLTANMERVRERYTLFQDWHEAAQREPK